MTGCKKNPVNSQSASVASMVKKINDGRPYYLVSIVNGSNWTNYSSSDFQDAYAEDGYLVIVLNDNSKSYYNLAITKTLNISHQSLDLYY